MKKFTCVDDVENVMDLVRHAQEIKKNPYLYKKLHHKTLGLVFFNPSLRTRLSSQKAAQNLGINTLIMNANQDNWNLEFEDVIMNQNSQEHIKEFVGVISQYCDVIGVRSFASLTDKEKDYQECILNQFISYSKVPIISLESTIKHPLQSLADALTISESWKEKRKPKVVLTWAPHPKPLPQAVANSFVEWMQQMPVELCIANPVGLNLCPSITKKTPILHHQEDALKDADFVYAKNWSSFEDYGQNKSEHHYNWMLTLKKMALTNHAKFMHCLPVRRNVEVSSEVLESPHSLIFQQAENRVYAAQSVLLNLLKE